MDPTKRAFSIAKDTKNGVVCPDRLLEELSAAELGATLLHVDTSGDELVAWFEGEPKDEVLAETLAAHGGEPPAAQAPSCVALVDEGDGNVKYIRVVDGKLIVT